MDRKKKQSIGIFILISIVIPVAVHALKAEATVKAKTLIAVSVPARIIIPTARLNTNVISVGITKEGKLDVPKNYVEAGWYKYGTVPGKIGSAVIDGHVDNGGKIPGPFKHLRLVKPGDNIYIIMNDGQFLHYSVLSADVYDTDKFPGEEVFHESGKAYLKIITCHGKFIPSIKNYDQRLIVEAVLVSEKTFSI
ncbi:MAG: class F sortase [bacterium]|nr:class F sortase [bacterium]